MPNVQDNLSPSKVSSIRWKNYSFYADGFLISPTKIIGIGANFKSLNASPETIEDYPSFFIMPPSALLPPGQCPRLPFIFKSAVVEGELGVIIARQAKNIPIKEVENYILGYVILDDLSGLESHV